MKRHEANHDDSKEGFCDDEEIVDRVARADDGWLHMQEGSGQTGFVNCAEIEGAELVVDPDCYFSSENVMYAVAFWDPDGEGIYANISLMVRGKEVLSIDYSEG